MKEFKPITGFKSHAFPLVCLMHVMQRIDPRTDELRKQVLKLSAETVTLQFEIEQTRMELPLLKVLLAHTRDKCRVTASSGARFASY